MVRKTLAVIVLSMATMLFGGAAAFASDFTTDAADRLDIALTRRAATWLFIGVAIIAVGATLAMLSHRPAGHGADTAALG